MLILAGFFGLLGLAFLFLEPRLPFWTTWQIDGGDKVKPSAEYIRYTRFFGVALVILAVVLVATHFSNQAQDDSNESVYDAWGVTVTENEPLKVEAEPDVVVAPDVAAELVLLEGDEEVVTVRRQAIVGTDAVGDLGVNVTDGDLWVSVHVGSCDLGHVVIQETDESVTVAITVVPDQIAEFTALTCDGGDNIAVTASSLLVVRVPLEDALGDRELTVVAPAPATDTP